MAYQIACGIFIDIMHPPNYTHYRPIIAVFIGLMSLISCKNDPTVSPEEVQYLEDYRAPVAKWGFINATGKNVIPYTYDAVRDFSEGLCAVNVGGKWGYINAHHDMVIAPRFKSAWSFHGGKALVKYMYNVMGWIDEKGILIDSFPQYTHMASEKHGYFKVRQNRLYGVVNNQGDLVIPCEFKSLSITPFDYFVVQDYQGKTLIDLQGQPMLNEYYSNVYPFSENQIYVQDARGALIIDLQNLSKRKFDRIIHVPFQHSIAPFESDDKYGLIHLNGSIITEPIYDDIIYAKENKWMVMDQGKFGLIDHLGNPITDIQYEMVHRYEEGYAAVRLNNVWGFIDSSGREIIAPQFALVWDFSDGLAQVIGERQLGFITPTGNYTQTTGYFEARSYKEGLCAVQEWK